MSQDALHLRIVRWILFLTMMGGAILGCQGQRAEDSVIRVALESEPSSLDPRLAVDAYSAKLNQLLYRGLFAYNERLELIPDALLSYDIVSPIRFHLRLQKGLRFHDGSPFTMEDVRYTYEWVRDPIHRSPQRENFSMIRSMRVLSPLEMEIELAYPYAPFLNRLTLGIVPKALGDRPQFAAQPIGAGPFQFVRWERGQFLRLKNNNNNNEIEFWFLPDENLRLLELIHGRIDLVQNAISPVLLPVLQGRSDTVIEHEPGINVAYLGMQLEHPILSKREVRDAIARAIDRNALLGFLGNNRARLADSLLAPENWAYAGLPMPDYNPPMAKVLLDAAGFPDPDGDGPLSRFRLTYKTSVQKDRIEMALLVGQFLKAVGIEVVVESREWGTFFRDIQNGHFELFSLTWVGLADPDVLYSIFHSGSVPPKGANRGHYRSPEVDALLQAARETYDLEVRKSLYAKVQALLAKDMPYVLLWYEDNVVARRKSVCGYDMRPNASFIGLTHVYRGSCMEF